MNTRDVMRKTLELAQSQLNNYKNIPMTDGDLIAELQVIIGKKDEKIVSQQALINAFTKLPDMPDNYTGMEALADHDKEVRRKAIEAVACEFDEAGSILLKDVAGMLRRRAAQS